MSQDHCNIQLQLITISMPCGPEINSSSLFSYLLKTINLDLTFNLNVIKLRMYKYGIDNTVVIHESENEIAPELLPGLGAANIQKIQNLGEQDDNVVSDRVETLQSLAANYVQVTISGVLPSVNISKIDTKSPFDLVFYNSELGIFSSAESTSIKPPLKPNSTLKQILSSTKTSLLNLNISVKPNQTRRSVKVIESHSKLVACGSIPVSFR